MQVSYSIIFLGLLTSPHASLPLTIHVTCSQFLLPDSSMFVFAYLSVLFFISCLYAVLVLSIESMHFPEGDHMQYKLHIIKSSGGGGTQFASQVHLTSNFCKQREMFREWYNRSKKNETVGYCFFTSAWIFWSSTLLFLALLTRMNGKVVRSLS